MKVGAQVKSNPAIRSNAERDFHQSEFSALKEEVAELVKGAAANFRYAAIGSGGIFAWLAAPHKFGEAVPAQYESFVGYAVWIPLLLSTMLAALSAAIYIRVFLELGKYLLELEKALGSRSLGWEQRFQGHPGTLGWISLYAWTVLILIDWGVAVSVTLLGHPPWVTALLPYQAPGDDMVGAFRKLMH